MQALAGNLAPMHRLLTKIQQLIVHNHLYKSAISHLTLPENTYHHQAFFHNFYCRQRLRSIQTKRPQ